MALSAGTCLGAYEIRALLGAGGMGEIYRARDTKLDRDVAVKVLAGSLAHDPAALARFQREAKVVAALSHPNIFAIHDFGRAPAGQGETVECAVMDLLEGETMRKKLEAGPIPPRKAGATRTGNCCMISGSTRDLTA
jgi:serine/threonine protein kinase